MLNGIAAWLGLGMYVAFGWGAWQRALTWLSKRIGDWIVALTLLPYLLATELHPEPANLLRLGLYVVVPTLLLRFRRPRSRPLDPLQLLAILALWVPVELDLFALLADTIVPAVNLSTRVAALRLLPEVRAQLLPGFWIPIESVTSVLLALTLFLIRHPVRDIGMTISLSLQDVRRALVGLVGFAVVGIPVGLLMDFIRFRPSLDATWDIIVGLVGGYLFTALPEELLFRGLIQNLLTKRSGRAVIALIGASAIFGLSHLNNSTARFAEPNWAYAAMATLAGIAYGWVWMQSHKSTASALTHTLVNAVWGRLFV